MQMISRNNASPECFAFPMQNSGGLRIELRTRRLLYAFTALFFLSTCQCSETRHKNGDLASKAAIEEIFATHICKEPVAIEDARSVQHGSTLVRRPSLNLNLRFTVTTERWNAYAAQNSMRVMKNEMKRGLVADYLMKSLTESERKYAQRASSIEILIDSDLNDSKDPEPLTFAFLHYHCNCDSNRSIVYGISLPVSVLIKIDR